MLVSEERGESKDYAALVFCSDNLSRDVYLLSVSDHLFFGIDGEYHLFYDQASYSNQGERRYRRSGDLFDCA